MSLALPRSSTGYPGVRILEEGFDRRELARREIAHALGDGEHVPPGGEGVEANLFGGQRLEALWEDAVMEDDEGVADDPAGGADRADEVELRGALAREILDQQHARPLRHLALDLGVAAEALRLLADIEHRQGHALGDPGGEGDAGGLAAGDRGE